MFKNKLLNIMIVMLFSITLMGGVAFGVIWYLKNDKPANAQPSIDEIISRSVDIKEFTTNLKDKGYVVISLKVQTDGKKAKEELEKRVFQVQNIAIQELASKDKSDLNSKQGLLELEELLKVRINELMQDGTVEKVYITNRMIQ